jgi:hypothetical protein
MTSDALELRNDLAFSAHDRRHVDPQVCGEALTDYMLRVKDLVVFLRRRHAVRSTQRRRLLSLDGLANIDARLLMQAGIVANLAGGLRKSTSR